MNKYRLVSNYDVNNYVDLQSTDKEECVFEALDVIGCSIVETTECDENQLMFDFDKKAS